MGRCSIETGKLFKGLASRQLLVPVRWCCLAGVYGPVIFILLFTIDGLLRPGYSAIYQAISDLGSGPAAWIFNGDLVLFGLFLFLFAYGFRSVIRTIMSGILLEIACVLLFLPGLGAINDALFVEDVFKNYPTTWHGMLHALGFILAGTAFLVAVFLIGLRWRKCAHWQWYGWYSIVTALLVFCLGLGLRILRIIGILTPATGGLVERSLLFGALSWYMVIGYKLFRMGSEQLTEY